MSKPFKLKNGMRVHLAEFKGTQAVTALVLCRVGSRNEEKKISGASHFIEHLMFKGTKKRPTTLDISRALDGVGAEYNAYTGKNLTGYYIRIDSAHTDLAVEMLHDMLFHSKFDIKELNRERGVVIEEINMYRDNPMMHVEDLLEQLVFEGNTLGWEIAGTHKTMKAMTRKDILAFRDEFYVPSRMVVAIAGKIPKNIKPLLNKTFGSVKEAKKEPREFVKFGGVTESKKPRASVQYKKTEQMQVAIGFESFGSQDKRNNALKLLSVILGGTMSSRLFISVRERKGLAYLIRSTNSAYDETGVFTIHAGLDKDRLKLAMKTIMQEVRKIKKDLVTTEELKQAKDHVRGQIMLQLENSSARASWYGRGELFHKKVKTPEEFIEKLSKVTKAQIRDAAREIFDEKKMRLAAIGPYKNEEAFLKAAGLIK
jgi:predicted Zn-dependent peptidase